MTTAKLKRKEKEGFQLPATSRHLHLNQLSAQLFRIDDTKDIKTSLPGRKARAKDLHDTKEEDKDKHPDVQLDLISLNGLGVSFFGLYPQLCVARH